MYLCSYVYFFKFAKQVPLTWHLFRLISQTTTASSICPSFNYLTRPLNWKVLWTRKPRNLHTVYYKCHLKLHKRQQGLSWYYSVALITKKFPKYYFKICNPHSSHYVSTHHSLSFSTLHPKVTSTDDMT